MGLLLSVPDVICAYYCVMAVDLLWIYYACDGVAWLCSGVGQWQL